MPDDMPDPMTELAAQAAQAHEMYSAYIQAGFTEQQAMQLVIAVLAANIRGNDA